MSLMFRYLALGISVALLAIGLARIIVSAFDFSWLVISIILLALLTLTILSRTIAGTGSGPTIRPVGLFGSSPHWSVQRHVSRDELKAVDNMMNQSQRSERRSISPKDPSLRLAIPAAMALVAILVIAIF